LRGYKVNNRPAVTAQLDQLQLSDTAI